ncbi:hypothetical protein DPMN_159903 [Dreissena polymorpha]|uniref:Uncharacterized protein n=1 Tax=Dreissena polymorpha TaxID=45954 RepID=A0A9D4EKI7_DREPO|nr:hypothetical protein DPMN_159903 [Dreissena polymorpha]
MPHCMLLHHGFNGQYNFTGGGTNWTLAIDKMPCNNTNITTQATDGCPRNTIISIPIIVLRHLQMTQIYVMDT